MSLKLPFGASFIFVVSRNDGERNGGGLPMCAAATAAAIDDTSPGEKQSATTKSDMIVHPNRFALNKFKNSFEFIIDSTGRVEC